MSLPFHSPLLFPGKGLNAPWQSEVRNAGGRALVRGMVCRFTYTAGMSGIEVTGEPATGSSPRASRVTAGVVYGTTIEPGGIGRIARCGLLTNILVDRAVNVGDLLSMSPDHFGCAMAIAKVATSLTSWFAVCYRSTTTRGVVPGVLFLRRWFEL